MKKYLPLFCCVFIVLSSCRRHEVYSGSVINYHTQKPIQGVQVISFKDTILTDSLGRFSLPVKGMDLIFIKKGYHPDTAKMYTNHSGEQIETFQSITEQLFPLNGRFRNLQDAMDAAPQPPALDTSIVFNSTQAKKFYIQGKSGVYTLRVPKGFVTGLYQEAFIPVKESHYGYYIAPGTTFLTAAKLSLNHINCEIIAATVPGKNNAKVLNFQLNSYDSKHKLLDALLLDSRFTFNIKYYSKFRVYGDGRIYLSRIAVDDIVLNKAGDVIGKKARADTTALPYWYQLDQNGQFIATKR